MKDTISAKLQTFTIRSFALGHALRPIIRILKLKPLDTAALRTAEVQLDAAVKAYMNRNAKPAAKPKNADTAKDSTPQ